MLKTERNIYITLAIILLLTTVIDIVTAVSSPVFEIAEINPIYVLTRSVLVMLSFSLLIVGFFIIRSLTRISMLGIFTYMMLFVYISAAHLFGAYSNVTSHQDFQADPEGYTEQVQAISSNDKINAYMLVIGLLFMMPMFLSGIAAYLTQRIYNFRQPKRERLVELSYNLLHKYMRQ